MILWVMKDELDVNSPEEDRLALLGINTVYKIMMIVL